MKDFLTSSNSDKVETSIREIGSTAHGRRIVFDVSDPHPTMCAVFTATLRPEVAPVALAEERSIIARRRARIERRSDTALECRCENVPNRGSK